MIWILYNVLFAMAFVLLLPRFFLRMWRRGGYRRHFLQRLGLYSKEVQGALGPPGRIWIHAVSVGEMYVALGLVREIRERDANARFVITTTTSTGYGIGRERVSVDDVLLYFPVDFPMVIRRVLKKIRPRMLILVECEFWPNLIRRAGRQGIPVVLVNGRISDRSYRGYRKLKAFTKRLFPGINLFCVQSKTDGDRLVELGAPEDRIRIMGSAKYEVAERNPEGERTAREVMRAAGMEDRHIVLLGGSTWPGEEAALLDIYGELKSRFPDLALVLVPRHVERSEEVIGHIESRNLPYARRSEMLSERRSARPAMNEGISEEGTIHAPPILLVDTTGELMHFYSCASIIFVGKSLTQHGGQNIIEPALYARPIIVGPNMENFPVVMKDFLKANALFQVHDTEEMKETVIRLMNGSDLRETYGERAARLVREKAGAVRKTVDELMRVT